MAIKIDAQKNAAATAYGTGATHGLLFTTAAPPTTGAATSEVAGGTYARKALTWSSPSAGVMTASATFDIPAGVTVRAVGVASASSGATVRDWVAVTEQAFATAGTYVVTLTYTQS